MQNLFIQPMFIGTTELLLVGGIALLLFGGKKLPEMMRGLGQGVQSFKQGMKEPPLEDTEHTEEIETTEEVPQSSKSE